MFSFIFKIVNYVMNNDVAKIIILLLIIIPVLLYFVSGWYDCEIINHGRYVKEFFGGYTCIEGTR